MLRPRASADGRWYWTGSGRGRDDRPARHRRPARCGSSRRSTGRLVGTVDEPSAHVLVHAGAVYPHQGEMYLVERA